MIEEAEQHNPREAQGDALSWGIINGVLLAGIGVAVFLVLWQFGSQGYICVTLGGIIITALVGIVHWFFLRKQAIASSWVRITIIVWIVTILGISLIFSGIANDQ